MPDLRPTTTLFLQFAAWTDSAGIKHDQGYYPVTWDETTSLVITPGTGVGVLNHGGKTYSLAVATPVAASASATIAQTDLTAALAVPIVTVTPDTFAVALASGGIGMIDLQPGHYIGSYDFTIPPLTAG